MQQEPEEEIVQIQTSTNNNNEDQEQEEDLEKLYEEIDNDEEEKKVHAEDVEVRQEIIAKNKTKLEKLLAQPDIFDCLRRINSGEIKSYDELDQYTANKYLQQQAVSSSKRGQGNNNEDLEEVSKSDLAEIQKIEHQPANLVGGSLRDYQIEGLNWLYKLYQANLNGILADEMGLGKTIQSIAIIALVESFKTEEQKKNRDTHHIIIVPKITLGKWKKEFQEWVPTSRLFYFYGSNEEREAQKIEMRKNEYDVILTTFETVIREKHELSKIYFDFLILDEAQRIKNDESVLSQVLRKFRTKHRILLTGTPLQNNLKELWALLNFLMPKLFDSAQEFKELFMVKNDDEGSQEYIIKQIHRLLRPFMLRRLKNDVEKHLPHKKEIYLFIGLSKLQKQLYKNILTGNIDVVNGIGDKIKLLNALMQLKKVCNHPYLFDKVEPGPPFIDGEHLVENSMKFKVLDLLLPKLVKEGCKVLIFSQMTRLLNILDDFLRYRGFTYCRIDGQTSANDRELRIEDFQREDSDKEIFILSTRAGGLGINLHSANIVIIFDSDWNPQVDLQAIDRAHRIGQKREVVVYRFVTEGSVEEKIVERAARKLKVDHLIMQKGKFNYQNKEDNPNKINAQEMQQMIKFGAQEIILSGEGDQQQMEANIDHIIEHSLKKTQEIQAVLSKIEDKFNLNNVSLTGDDEKQTDLYMFEGQDYKKKQDKKDNIEIDFIDIGQRERKQLSYDIDKYYREALNIPTQTKEKKKLKGWRAHANGGYDHQFFDSERLDQLEEKENQWNLFNQNQEEYLKNNKTKPPQYTKKDQQTKEHLIAQGFPNWSKKDFFAYIRLCETFGRDNYSRISEGFNNKSIEDVRKYSEVFWKKCHNIENGQKYIERIEKGEQEIEKQKQIEHAIEQKFTYQFTEYIQAQEPAQQDLLNFRFDDITIMRNDKRGFLNGFNPNFDFTDEEDKFLAYGIFKYGYGQWELIRNEYRNCDRFQFNWIVKTRTIQDIQRRCDYLVSKFKKEIQIIEKMEEEKKQKEKEEEEERLKKMKAQQKQQIGKKNVKNQKVIQKPQQKGIVPAKRKLSQKGGKKKGALSADSDEGNDEEEESVSADDNEESNNSSDSSEFKVKTKKKNQQSAKKPQEHKTIDKKRDTKKKDSTKEIKIMSQQSNNQNVRRSTRAHK